MQKKIRYLIFGIILILAFFLRVYRVGSILGFYFDQGRDALVIWDLIHLHKFFLIGPTTGLAGIFRGPYYYYLIAPFYLIGRGNPVLPSIFLAFTTVLATFLGYKITLRITDKISGVIFAIISGFSFNIVIASRWLSNPTPMLLLSMLLVWCLVEIVYGTKKEKIQKWWVILAGVFGLSLFSFGSSGEFFYTPALIIFAIWQRKKWPTLKYFLLSIFVFILTFAPLILFDLKHDHILLHNFLSTFGGGSGSFGLPDIKFINIRNQSYIDIFTNKIFQDKKNPELIVLLITAIAFLISLPKLLKNKGAKIILLLLLSSIIGLYFFQGNEGVLYDYYMTGYYLIFIMLFAIILGIIWRVNIIGKIFIIYFLYLFFMNNIPVTWGKITDGCDRPESICFINQRKAVQWIYNDAQGRKFNVDEYVPPVIPYAYQYLLEWKTNPDLTTQQVPLLYTLYEIDPPHPERLKAWLDRQKGIGKVEATYQTGGITVERRTRIIKK
jgi:4-amino-4-deoxy-L-arabinose transferase-like glycosyltransferase